MHKRYLENISNNLNVKNWQISAVENLFNDKATLPFIARYRKEATGNLDEELLRALQKQLDYFNTLEKRKEHIIKVIADLGKLTSTLEQKIQYEIDADKLEDIFLPYKPSRKTRATKAREAGLEPLAQKVLLQKQTITDREFSEYTCEAYSSVEHVKEGVNDIIADVIATNPETREAIRKIYEQGSLHSKIKPGVEDAGKYSNYIKYTEPLTKVKMHRVLAVFRGVKENILSIGIQVDEASVMRVLKRAFLKGYGTTQEIILNAIDDAYKRLIHPSLENETLRKLKEKADNESVKLFSSNLRQLLMAPPLGEKRVLAIDPGYRTGCKVVCLDERGDLLHNETIFPHPPQNQVKQSIKKVLSLTDAYKPDVIAIGNGTASKETERFIKKIKFTRDLDVFMVNEDGASVYSASSTAREEFPEYDVTVRGAISIGRRLSDPLAELIKIDPKSIGVGQYQHDVDQKLLKEELDKTVFSCVNEVGVNLNTASRHLLAYVSGLGTVTGKNIVDYRKKVGKFNNRKELLNVPKLGPKAFEQAAGFLRIKNGENPLDNTAVHPESYHIVEKIGQLKNASIQELIEKETSITEKEKKEVMQDEVGEYTLVDIMKELNQHGLDPRGESSVFTFNQHIERIEDLKENMLLPGVITNITDFGAFVDIGIKQNGLIHISEIAEEYIAHPSEKLNINQQLVVRVKSVEVEKNRIQLSLKNATTKDV